MIIADKPILADFGILSEYRVSPYDLAPEEEDQIRPNDAVPKLHGISFHLIERNTDHGIPRELNLVLFPFLKKYLTCQIHFDQHRL